MSKWRKRIPILVVALSALALCIAALSFATTDEDQKEDYVQQVNAARSTSQAELLHPDVVAKLAMEAEIQAKIEAEQEGGGEEPPSKKAAYSTKDNEFGVSSIAGHPVIERDPGSVLLSEDFEAETFPPVGWDTAFSSASGTVAAPRQLCAPGMPPATPRMSGCSRRYLTYRGPALI